MSHCIILLFTARAAPTWSHRIPCNDHGPLTPNLWWHHGIAKNSPNRRKFRDGLTEVIPMQVSDRHQPWSTHGSTGSTPALPQLTCVDHVKRVTPVQLYLYINLYFHWSTYPPLNNITHVTGKDKCSHRYLLQKLTINKHYKQVVLHSKSSEAIRSLYAKKRVKHEVLIAENDPAPLTRSHLIQKVTPVS